MSSRSKGKRYERDVIEALKKVFPNCHRNWLEQSAQGGVDINDTPRFAFEVKGGKQANIAKIRKWLNQLEDEVVNDDFKVLLARPIRENWYALMPFDDFLKLLIEFKKNEIAAQKNT